MTDKWEKKKTHEKYIKYYTIYALKCFFTSIETKQLLGI